MIEDVVVFDIDGVLADNTNRLHYVTNGETDWEGFYSEIPNDLPNIPMIKLANMLYWDMDYNIILLSSRPTYTLPDTQDWLIANEIPSTKIILRPKDDFDKLWKVKQLKSIRNDYIILWVFEDDPINIDLFKQNDFPIVPIHSGNWPEVYKLGLEVK